MRLFLDKNEIDRIPTQVDRIQPPSYQDPNSEKKYPIRRSITCQINAIFVEDIHIQR
jgi:hypothetical protein